MDLYNLEIISYKISKRPTLDIALDPLDEALEIIKERAPYRTTIHSARVSIIKIGNGLIN